MLAVSRQKELSAALVPGAAASRGDAFGLPPATDAGRDFGKVMQRMRQLRAQLSGLDSAKRFTDLGVDVFIGSGSFTSPGTVQVGNATLRFRRAAICTGARATAPPISGLADAGFLTNETVFSLTRLPRRLVVHRRRSDRL